MRKTLATLLSIAMVLSFVAGMFTFSLTSTAATTDAEYAPAESVYVNGTTLDATNTSVACGSGTASFDAATGTLTLTDATVDDYVYAEIGALTVVLVGDNEINGSNDEFSFSLRGHDGLTIKGTGTLTVPNGVRYVIGAISGDLNILGSVSIVVAGPQDLIHMGANAGPDGRADANITIGEDAEVTLVAQSSNGIRSQQGQGGAVIIKDNALVDIIVTNASNWGVGIAATSNLRILDNCEVNITMTTSNQCIVGINHTTAAVADNALYDGMGSSIFAGGTLNINITNNVASNPRSYCYLAKGVQNVLFSGTDVTVNIQNAATSTTQDSAYFIQQNNDKANVFGVSTVGVHSASWTVSGGSITVADGSVDYIPLFKQDPGTGASGNGTNQNNSRLNVCGGTIRGTVAYFNRYRGQTSLMGGDIDVTCTVGVTGTNCTSANFDTMTHAAGSAFAIDSTLLKCSGVAPIYLGDNAATTLVADGATVNCGGGTLTWDGVNRVLTLNNAELDTGIFSRVPFTLNVLGNCIIGENVSLGRGLVVEPLSGAGVYDQERDFLASLVVEGTGTLDIYGDNYIVYAGMGNILMRGSASVGIYASTNNCLHISANARNGTLWVADSATLFTTGAGQGIYLPGVAPAVKISDNAELVTDNGTDGVLLLSNVARYAKEAPTMQFEVSGHGKYTSSANRGIVIRTNYNSATAVRSYATGLITVKDNAVMEIATASNGITTYDGTRGLSRAILTVEDEALLEVNKGNNSGDCLNISVTDVLYGSARGAAQIFVKDNAQLITVNGNCGIRNSQTAAYSGAPAATNVDATISVSGNALLDVSGCAGQAINQNVNTTGTVATFEVKDAATASVVHPNKNWNYGIALQMAAPTVNFNITTTGTVTLTGYQSGWNGALYLNGATVNALVENATLNVTNTLPDDIAEDNDHDVSNAIYAGRSATTGAIVIGCDAVVNVTAIQNSPTKTFRAHGIYLNKGLAMIVKDNAELNVLTAGSCTTPQGISSAPIALQANASVTFAGVSTTTLNAEGLSNGAIYGENDGGPAAITVTDDAVLTCTGGRLATIQTLREQGSGNELTFNVEGGSVVLDNSYDYNPAINTNVIVNTANAQDMTILAGDDQYSTAEVTDVASEPYVEFNGWGFGTVAVQDGDSVTSATLASGFEIAGAQIRTSDPTGLRFVARISQRVIDHYAAQGTVKYGILVQRAASLANMASANYISAETLTMANTLAGKTIGNGYAAAVEGEFLFESHDGYVYYTALITGMPAANVGDDIVARAYIQVGDTVIYATETAPSGGYAVAGAYAYAGGYCVSATNVATAVKDQLSDEMKALYNVQ